jgi:hypothetical protein
MKNVCFVLVLLLVLPIASQPQSHPSYSVTAEEVLDDINYVGTVWFSEKDKAFSDHLTSLTIQLGTNPRIQSEYSTLVAKPEAQRQAWLAMLVVNAYYAGYSRSLKDAAKKGVK